MAFTPITVTFNPPLINDPPATFDSKAFQVWLDLQDWTTQANAVGQYVSDETAAFQQSKEDALVEVGAEVGNAEAAASDSQTSAENAYNYAQTVQSVANFKGRWSDISGALSVPASVLHNGSYWNLTQDVANVSAQEPSDANANWDKLEIIQEVSRPQAISPISGATNVIPQPELSASPYEVIYSSDSRMTRRFQVDLATGDFSTPIYDATENSDSHTVTAQLAFDTSHKWRCRDESSEGRVSQWMSAQSFTTGAVSIAEPAVSVSNSPSDVPESPVIETGAFSVLGGSDTHLNTDWQVLDDQLTVVWESLADATNKLSITVPSGILSVSSDYTFRARHRGNTYGASLWGSVTATTSTSFVPSFEAEIGAPYGGGYVAGKIVSDYDGVTYGLIVSDGGGDSVKQGAGTMMWRNARTSVTTTHGVPPMTLADGRANQNAILALNALADFPAFKWIEDSCNAGAGLNGHTDWYLPSRDELEIIYRNFKPTTDNNDDGTRYSASGFGADGAVHGTNANSVPAGTGYTLSAPSQTAQASFQATGADAFEADYYWSSTEIDTNYAWIQRFSDGYQSSYFNVKDTSLRVRAVRRVAL